MYTMITTYSNGTKHYDKYTSLWASDYIGQNIAKDKGVDRVEVINSATGELLQFFAHPNTTREA